MEAAAPPRPNAPLSPPTTMYTTDASSASADAPRQKGGSLHDRLRARHHDAIERFKVAARRYNSDVDAAQHARIEELHHSLAESHAATAALLAEEQHRLADCVAEWQAHEDVVQSAAADDVLPLYTDLYHSTPDEQGRTNALHLMKHDRLRIVRHTVVLHDHYRLRIHTIDHHFRAIEAAEEGRRVHIQDAVRDLMASLTRIAVTSTTQSQVLAQRILHHTNEQLGQNYLAMQTLVTQLRQRELWKHQHYQHILATVYRETQTHMARRHITWTITVLRSSVFRRPEGRMQSVHAAGRLIADIRREADELMRGVTEVVASLQLAQPSTVTAEQQVCGGSGPNGWLRSFQASVHDRGVFAGEDPRAVLEEAQMRASVLVRHCRARCNSLNARLRGEEEARAQAAATLAANTCHDVVVIATPLSEEVELLQAASFSLEDVGGGGGSDGDLGGADGTRSVDAALSPLTQPHAAVMALQETLITSPAWSQCVPAIVLEGQWFVRVMSRGLVKGCQLFCSYATTSNSSVLVHLEGATDLLFSTATALLGATRASYVQWREHELDYQDAVAALEQQLLALEDELRQDETPAAAEARYASGIACLQSIADTHTRYYEDVRRRIATATSSLLTVSQDCLRELAAQLGLALYPLAEEEGEAAMAVPPMSKRRSLASFSRHLSARPSFLSASAASSAAAAAGASTATRGSVVSPSAPVDDRPRITASHGEVFVQESPHLRFVCMVQRGEGRAGGGETDDDAEDAVDGEAEWAAAKAPADDAGEPGAPFQQFYLGLLPELQPHQGPLFLQRGEVVRWTEGLRTTLLEWGLQLQRQAGENWRLYTTRLLADVQQRVMDVLRHHRRRPATLQADVYEARVRELADLKNRGEKVLARIAERVSRVHTLQQAFLSQPALSAADRTLSEERARLIESVHVVSSAKAMHIAIHRHDTLCAQYNAALAERCTEATCNLEQARDTIEAECAQILRDRAAELSGGDCTAVLPADDPIQLRVDHLRDQVQTTLRESMAAMETQRAERAGETQRWKDEWAAVVEQSSAELELFQGAQEALSSLRARVQTLLSASATEEVALAAGVAKLTEESAKAQSTHTYDLAASLQALLRHEVAAGAGGANATGVEDLPSLDEVRAAVTQALAVAKSEQRERVRGAPVCGVLAVLDDLRMPLYSRGCRLGALAHGVEMWRVSPSHFLLPQALGEEGSGGGGHGLHRVGSAGRIGSARGGKRTKATLGAQSAAVTAMMGHTLLPLPAVLTLMAQVGQWTTELRANAESAAHQHLEAHPGPLQRRLPGMTEGTESGFVAAVAALCHTQEERVRSYAAKAGPTYRQQVQELWNAQQGTPALLAATLEAEAAAAAFTRVEAVLRPWQRFHARSAQQWQRHRGSAKLSLASQVNSAALSALSEAEAARSYATEEALQLSWSSALRELQDEAGLHVARCWTALYTYLHLLSGLVTPQHLLTTVQVADGGQHRGLRHLLDLRAQRERAAAAMDASAVTKREPRLQETMPLPSAGSGGKRHSSKNPDKTGGARDANGLPMLAPLPWGEVELPGLQLNGCAPLSAYNADHPQSAVAAPPAATPYVPRAAGTAAAAGGVGAGGAGGMDSKAAQSGSRRQNSNSVPSGQGGRKSHPSTSPESPAAMAAVTASAAAVEMSAPLVVPRFPLSLECAQLLRGLVRSVTEEGNEAARVIADAFSFWERHEAQLRQTWAMTLAELTSDHP